MLVAHEAHFFFLEKYFFRKFLFSYKKKWASWAMPWPRRLTFCTRSVGQSFWAIDPKSWSLVVSSMRNRIKRFQNDPNIMSVAHARRTCKTFRKTYKGAVGRSFWAIDLKSWSLVVSIMRNRIKKVSERSEHYVCRACATHVQYFSQNV